MMKTRTLKRQPIPPVFQICLLSAEGQYETVAEIVSKMQADGTDQRLIDRWLQGLEAGRR